MLSVLGVFSTAQQSFTIKGYVKDQETNEALIGATVYQNSLQKGTATNEYGFFSFKSLSDSIVLEFSYVGYNLVKIQFDKDADSVVVVHLEPNKQIEEVVVVADYTGELHLSQASVDEISVETINSLPVLLGESDVLKSIQLLPGVISGTEGASGYHVRGGSSDQNLILIDGVPVYNAYHLYGFFSVFNTDAIHYAKLYKGGMPARFGGRLSSVLDLRMKEGNSNDFSGDVSLGMVASKFMFEGPIVKGKTSFLITGRRSMTDLIYDGITDKLLKNENQDKSQYYFYDVNAKINHVFSNRSRIYLSMYTGHDNSDASTEKVHFSDISDLVLTNKNSSEINWGNTTSVFRWNYLLTDNLFSNFTLYYSKYRYNSSDNKIFTSESSDPRRNFTNTYERNYFSEIKDYSAKTDFDLNLHANYLKFGCQYIQHTVSPGVETDYFNADAIKNIETTVLSSTNAHEMNFYVEDDMKFSNQFNCNAGIHASGYFVNDKFFRTVQPRFSGNYHPLKKWAFKASYARMVQYLHLLSNSSLGLPTELWISSEPELAPEFSDQYVLAMTYMPGDQFSISIEAFKKDMHNLIAYKEGASYLAKHTSWDEKTVSGKGASHGVEFMIDKKAGKTTGWISYTYSISTRTFDELNYGREFPYKYDRTHDVSIVLMHQLNDHFDLGATWVYATGNAITLANEVIAPPLAFKDLKDVGFITSGAEYYNSINAFRMPDYHRLDINVNYQNRVKQFEYKISLGAYNVYNRQNPYYLYFVDGVRGREIAQRSLFPVLPYVNCSLKF